MQIQKEKSNFDILSEVLFDGDVKTADIKTMPGSDNQHSSEEAAGVLLASLRRVGIVKDGKVVDLN